MTPIDHANEVIASVRQKTDRAILFYSCGKDSEVLLDLMAPHFKEIVCVFMYFVKGLDHIDNYLRAVKARYANVTILQVPHWTLTRVLRCGLYCIPNPNVKLLSLKDVDESVRMKTGISYSFYGNEAVGRNESLSYVARIRERSYKQYEQGISSIQVEEIGRHGLHQGKETA